MRSERPGIYYPFQLVDTQGNAPTETACNSLEPVCEHFPDWTLDTGTSSQLVPDLSRNECKDTEHTSPGQSHNVLPPFLPNLHPPSRPYVVHNNSPGESHNVLPPFLPNLHPPSRSYFATVNHNNIQVYGDIPRIVYPRNEAPQEILYGDGSIELMYVPLCQRNQAAINMHSSDNEPGQY